MRLSQVPVFSWDSSRTLRAETRTSQSVRVWNLLFCLIASVRGRQWLMAALLVLVFSLQCFCQFGGTTGQQDNRRGRGLKCETHLLLGGGEAEGMCVNFVAFGVYSFSEPGAKTNRLWQSLLAIGVGHNTYLCVPFGARAGFLIFVICKQGRCLPTNRILKLFEKYARLVDLFFIKSMIVY